MDTQLKTAPSSAAAAMTSSRCDGAAQGGTTTNATAPQIIITTVDAYPASSVGRMIEKIEWRIRPTYIDTTTATQVIGRTSIQRMNIGVSRPVGSSRGGGDSAACPMFVQ